MTYEIIRSSRKTLAVCISPQNKVIVRCPRRITDKQVDKFITSKADWISKVLKNNEIKYSANSGVVNYKEIYVGGAKLPIVISDKNFITAEAVFLKSLSYIKSTFISKFSADFIKTVRELSERLNMRAGLIKFKSYKSRWGCCDRNNNLTFNYLLFMLPFRLQRYVIIHELCHTVYFNHSKSFWDLVKLYLPDYKNLRKELKSFDFIINLY